MFVDKYTGKVKWINLLIAKAGAISALAVAVHYSAHFNPFVKNMENMVFHGPRLTAEGFYRGDADISVEVNRNGDIERYLVFLPSEEKYALGEDGYPKEPKILIEGLENRIKSLNYEQKSEVFEKLNQIEKKYSD